MIHALIYVTESNFEMFIPKVEQFLTAAILNSEDEACGRLACGLVSDIANYLEKKMSNFSRNFMDCLNNVLYESQYSSETKLHAMIAVGDICLAIEEYFLDYFDKTMECLFSAVSITIQPANFENEDLMGRLRDAIIDAFISIIHGMHPLASGGNQIV